MALETISFATKRDEPLPLQCLLSEISCSRGITAAQIAKRLDVTRQAVGKWFSGDTPGPAYIEKLCDLLDCQPGELLIFFRYPAPSATVELLTAGYEGEDQDGFIAKLKAAKVEVLVDTREIPLSRKRGFSKNGLAERLASEGIEYRHFKELGTLKSWRTEYYADKDWGKLADRYSEGLSGLSASLKEVYDLSSERRICLFCFEADHNRCHRSILAEHLVHHFSSPVSLEVIHL